jgi:hypothetical protein
MIYNLNHNYGKVTLTGNEKHVAAVYNHLGKMQHIVFAGTVDITDTSNGYLTLFFGSSGYKTNDDDSWTFCKGLLAGYVTDNRCYVVTDNNKPIDCVSSHALYDQLTSLIALGNLMPAYNVYSLR